jgi:putative N6-adenine-specific DNA methylase
LQKLGAKNINKERRAVSFSGDMELMYRANLSLRTASRVLKIIHTFNAKDADEIYTTVKKINWEDYMSVNQTISIDSTVYSDTFRHSQFVSYRVKDAIADYFSEKYEKRPSVRLTNPDVMINIHIAQNRCTLSLDSSGDSLHKRGYRVGNTQAPINEALAAGMLLLAGWDGQSDFYDPMCGSGTLLIEAALIALNIPPGLFRKSFQFEKWNDFDKELFDNLYNDDSMEREFNFKICGSDLSENAIAIALDNVKSAGLSRYVEIKKCSITNFEPASDAGLIVTNPPYGERLKEEDLLEFYSQIGQTFKHRCSGKSAWVICSNVEYLQNMGLKPARKIKLMNGELPCEYWKFELFAGKRKEFLRDSRR